ncbi:hypothetical protein HBI24_163970 [Parastagonospora nodorum]|nr:hypothetical protein HBH42_136090 [Parastagonospora nodorum]KAH4206521.1 hypothetical protein HBI95_116770 [Parastagonospora nodorum]KAH5152605.1 hypothetical protein HBH69_137880 [Parastagonospora nodorum]KAH5413632.1 hypothetical protein HBI32_123400 [Parastagonospora nodorum]KAH5522331.1 hypothetical protein HBI52_068510 [Parastagonospora nodorum]
MSPPSPVLIFGPSGAVASSAALELQRLNHPIYLAMRDPSKPLPGLSTSIPRLQADLSELPSLTRAVQESGATTAFLYTIWSSSDHMASTFSTLQSAGITFIVLLSSFTVRGDQGQDTDMSQHINAVHARTEAALAASGVPYVAARPAYFNSNVLANKAEIKAGKVGLVYPDVPFDFIAPSDVGVVCARLLTSPPPQERHVYLCGPEMVTQRRAHEEVIAKALGTRVEIVELGEEAWFEKMEGWPRGMVESVVQGLRETSQGKKEAYPEWMYGPAVENVRRLKGSEPMGLGEWVEKNREVFE